MILITEIDTLSLVARETYGERGAVLVTVGNDGSHSLEAAEIVYESAARKVDMG